MQRLSDAEVQKFRAGRDERRMERLGAPRRAGVGGVPNPGKRACQFPGAAVTKYGKLGGFSILCHGLQAKV